MKALVYHSPGKNVFDDRPRPVIEAATDAIVKVTNATICGSDLGAMRGNAPHVARGRILGDEGTGIIEQVGEDVFSFRVGDCVLISCLTSCGICAHCKRGENSRCDRGGWLLGNAIDGTYAEYVRVPFADHSLFSVPGVRDDRVDGPWIDNFPGGSTRGVFYEPDERRDTAPIVFGSSVGMGPLLAVMQYYRTVVRPISRTNGNGHTEARERAPRNAQKSFRSRLHNFVPTKSR